MIVIVIKPFQGPLKPGGGDSWMSPINRQFSNMGLLVRHLLVITQRYSANHRFYVVILTIVVFF